MIDLWMYYLLKYLIQVINYYLRTVSIFLYVDRGMFDQCAICF